MSDFVIGLIRTYVPIAVGFVISFLVANQWVDDETGAQVVAQISAGVTALLSAIYYTAIRLLAERWPWFGSLLGVNVAPKYNE